MLIHVYVDGADTKSPLLHGTCIYFMLKPVDPYSVPEVVLSVATSTWKGTISPKNKKYRSEFMKQCSFESTDTSAVTSALRTCGP